MDELAQVRQDVSYLREANGRHDANIQNLTQQLTNLTVAVTNLTAVMNRGRGALWAIVAASGIAGSVATWAIEYFARGKI